MQTAIDETPMALSFLSPYSFTKVFGDWGRKDRTRFLFCPSFKGAPCPKLRLRQRLDGGWRPGGATGFPEKALKS